MILGPQLGPQEGVKMFGFSAYISSWSQLGPKMAPRSSREGSWGALWAVLRGDGLLLGAPGPSLDSLGPSLWIFGESFWTVLVFDSLIRFIASIQ